MSDSSQVEEMQESLFVYGRYVVDLCDKVEKDQDGHDINYTVTNQQLNVCEATSSSLPQAMSIAVALDRAVDQILEDLDQEAEKGDLDLVDTRPKESLLN